MIAFLFQEKRRKETLPDKGRYSSETRTKDERNHSVENPRKIISHRKKEGKEKGERGTSLFSLPKTAKKRIYSGYIGRQRKKDS